MSAEKKVSPTPESPPPAEVSAQLEQESPSNGGGSTLWTTLRAWGSAHRIELGLFVVSYLVLAAFSSQRFLRQSEAPHFIYQAKAWLEGRIDVDPEVLPNIEDWACVREVNGEKTRCEGRLLRTDKWYVSFPPFPALAMLPFVAINGYQFNDTSFGVFIGALAIALFYSLLRHLSETRETNRSRNENIALALVFAFGTLFFYCAIRGEVWFTAEVMGVALTCAYVRCSIRAKHPFLAGMFFSMAVLTRTPLLFAGVFFLVECVAPQQGARIEQLTRAMREDKSAREKLGWFFVGMAPLALGAALFNYVRFGSFSEFGHKFFYNNRVNTDIDQYGLFHPIYLARNLEAAFLKLPEVSLEPLRLSYDPHGLSLLLTLPLLLFIVIPKERRQVSARVQYVAVGALVTGLLCMLIWATQPMARLAFWLGWAAIATTIAFALYWHRPHRLFTPLWLTVGACALPGLFYQNTGYMQFGFRFSLDYTPYLLLLFAISGWSLRHRAVQAAIALGVLVNFWGAVAFRGYTELVRRW